MTATLTPTALDQAAARALDRGETAAWQTITDGWQRTAPAARRLVTKTVDELVAEALAAPTTRPAASRDTAVDIRLPGRLARTLPDWATRRPTNSQHGPDVILAVAAQILREWGWQNTPHKLRDRRGRRCICGAICAAHDLGVGTLDSAHAAAGMVLAELRRRGWQALIGDWNACPGRTAQQAIQLIDAARTH